MIRSLIKETRQAWSELELYQRFEQIIVIIISLLIAVVIALSTWHLVVKLFQIARADLIDPSRAETFQEIFDMIIIVLIALEFNYTVLGIVERGHSIIQVKAVVLIALLAVLRKFIVLELEQDRADGAVFSCCRNRSFGSIVLDNA